MSLTVFAQMMGLFHKGSGGKGIAPLDVCLSPPPPPAGPVPIPYVNMLSAADLTKGSKTVKIDGEPTALEDASEVSTSTGDEPGTQGGGVVTHKTKGKGSFTLWSFTVKVEGKGVARHGDMMLQNTASKPPNCIDAAAITKFEAAFPNKGPCKTKYRRGRHAPPINDAQYDACLGGPCWECAKLPNDPGVWDTLIEEADGEYQFHEGTLVVKDRKRKKVHAKSKRDKKGKVVQEAFTPDHQPPLVVAWRMGGCHDPKKFKEFMADTTNVKPHCRKHAQSQGSQAAAYGREDYPYKDGS